MTTEQDRQAAEDIWETVFGHRLIGPAAFQVIALVRAEERERCFSEIRNRRMLLHKQYEVINITREDAIYQICEDAIRALASPVAESEGHDSDCATHNEPALPNGPCNCSKSLTPPDKEGCKHDDGYMRIGKHAWACLSCGAWTFNLPRIVSAAPKAEREVGGTTGRHCKTCGSDQHDGCSAATVHVAPSPAAKVVEPMKQNVTFGDMYELVRCLTVVNSCVYVAPHRLEALARQKAEGEGK